jgi:hypothetical protein
MAKSRIKVPKKVVGVKIPKAVRKGPILDFVNSNTGRMLIAQALTAAIGVFAYKQADPETREKLRGKVRKGTGDARELMSHSTARLSYAFGEAVNAFRAALNEPGPDDRAESDTQPVAEEGKKNKKQSWSSPEPASPH